VASSLAQLTETSDHATHTTSSPPALTTGTGSGAGIALLAACTNDTSVASSPTANDNVNAGAYTLLGDITSTADGQRFAIFGHNNCAASTATTLTINWGLSVTFQGSVLIECTGVFAGAGAIDKTTGQPQATPTTGTDATTSGTTGTLSDSIASLVVGLVQNTAGAANPAQGTGFSPPTTGAASFWNFAGLLAFLQARVEYKRVTGTNAGQAATFTAGNNSGHVTFVVTLLENAPPAGGVTTLQDEAPPRRPPLPSVSQRTREVWSAQPLGASQPVKSFLATEGMQPRTVPPIRRDHVPWILTGISAPTVKPWFDASPQVRVPPRAPPLLLDPGLSSRPLGVSQPIKSFLQQNPTVAPARRPPLPYQQQWERSPIVANLASVLLNDEAQVVRPRRIRVWAPMGTLARATVASTGGGGSFSLAADASGRFLTNNSTPWPMFTRTAWGLATLSPTNYKALIDDTVAKGYTAIEWSAIHHDPRSTAVPFANAGTLLPFDKTLAGATWTGLIWPGATHSNLPDFTTPLVPYWNYVRDIIDYAASKGLVNFFYAAYMGIGGDDGWDNEEIENGLTNMAVHGAFVATLLKTRGSIVWGMCADKGTGGGAFTAPELAAEQGFIQGLLSVGGQASTMFGSEWHSPSIMADQTDFVTGTSGPTFGDVGTIQTYYEFTGDVITQARRAWNSSPTKPAVLQECPFENEGPSGTNDNSAATDPVRRYHWWALLNGIAGYDDGEAYTWRCNLTGTPPASDDFRNHLNSTTSQDDARMHTLYRSFSWWKLIPSGLSSMVTLTALGTGNQTLASACASDGTVLLIYSGPDGNGGQFTVNLTRMNNNSRARWFDPTSGSFSTGGGAAGTFSLSNAATAQSFTPPGTNGGGVNNDWVLVIDA
jgi:hypothetical protein